MHIENRFIQILKHLRSALAKYHEVRGFHSAAHAYAQSVLSRLAEQFAWDFVVRRSGVERWNAMSFHAHKGWVVENRIWDSTRSEEREWIDVYIDRQIHLTFRSFDIGN